MSELVALQYADFENKNYYHFKFPFELSTEKKFL